MQVKYAHGEVEKSENKIFVGGLPGDVTEEDIKKVIFIFLSII
jgi:RNA recognition motif-containing protein